MGSCGYGTCPVDARCAGCWATRAPARPRTRGGTLRPRTPPVLSREKAPSQAAAGGSSSAPPPPRWQCAAWRLQRTDCTRCPPRTTAPSASGSCPPRRRARCSPPRTRRPRSRLRWPRSMARTRFATSTATGHAPSLRPLARRWTCGTTSGPSRPPLLPGAPTPSPRHAPATAAALMPPQQPQRCGSH